MSFPTQSTFVHVGTFDKETRAHPCMKWMENYTKSYIDTRSFSDGSKSAEESGHAPDFTLQKSTGEVVEGRDAAWKALAEIYGPFSAHVHDPAFLCCWETDDGYGMIGVANLSWNLAVPDKDAKQIKGANGDMWDGITPGAFKFDYVKDGDSFLLKRTEIYSDPSAAMITMMKRGMLKPEDLANM